MWRLLIVTFVFTSNFLLTKSISVNVPDDAWWKDILIYQIYPRSFMDSDGDGIGDLNGITSRLEHIRESGASALWLSPIYKSPQVDFGYDISDFTDIEPDFGNLGDFRQLVNRAKSLGLRVFLDLVPNHSSDQHDWFKKSVRRIKPYDDYYIWRDGKIINGTRFPPSNWLSSFGGPSWEWNEIRGQYYYHQFAVAQPDLNYRNPQVRKEMENVIRFWMDQGVDGFRIDAIVHLFEDESLRDEPLSRRPGVRPDEYDYLEHIYTRDLDEIYDVAADWHKLAEEYSRVHKTASKYMIVEAGIDIALNVRYYDVGVDPFNFIFTLEIHDDSPPSTYVEKIQSWLDNVPHGNVPNWVTGNHDNSRVASRFGRDGERADQITMIALLLPGITVIYNGDEIGMRDRPMSYEETVDPAGCNAGPERYSTHSRDPARTPFQWDNTTSAGFSTNRRTWLPVNDNYHYLNLLSQQENPVSHFNIFKSLARLKRTALLRLGQTEVSTDKHDKVLGLVRRLPHRAPLALVINMVNEPIALDLRSWMHLPDNMNIYAASVHSDLPVGASVRTFDFILPGAAAVVLSGPDLFV